MEEEPGPHRKYISYKTEATCANLYNILGWMAPQKSTSPVSEGSTCITGTFRS